MAVKKTEVFVTDKNKDTFYIEGVDGDNMAQGILSDLKLGPWREKEDKGWPIHLKYLERSIVEVIATQDGKCSIRDHKGKGSSLGGIHSGKTKDGKFSLPVCLEF